MKRYLHSKIKLFFMKDLKKKDLEKFEVILSEGVKISIDPKEPKKLFHDVVIKVLIPYYEKSNDWNRSIRTALNEISTLRMRYGNKMPNLDYPKLLLEEIEKKLGHEIDKIQGVDKIEILFLNLDDYTEEINDLMEEGKFSKEEQVRVLGDMISGLNTFEISELLIHYIRKSRTGK